jgi:hypothetical protein
VVSISSSPAAASAATSAAAITARTTDDVSCVVPITPGTELLSEVAIITMAAVIRAIPIP